MSEQIHSLIDESNELQCLRNGKADRRQQHFRSVLYSMRKGRRKTARRDNEHALGGYYVDVYERPLFYIAVGSILLCVADAYFTMILLNFFGSHELNPVMDYFIQRDTLMFFVVKFAITSIGVLFLVMHKNFKLLKRISGTHILYSCFFMYAVLVFYELVMIVFLPLSYTLSKMF